MSWLFSPDGFFNPQLSYSVQAIFRCAYGILLLGFLCMAIPHWRRFFISERWGGYAKSSPLTDVLQSPVGSVALGLTWAGCGIALIAGWQLVACSLINLLICRYLFIEMRWQSVTRGCGAPGFMSYWLAAAVFLLEFTTQ